MSIADGKTPSSLEPLSVAHVLLSLDVGGLERNVVNQVSQGHKLGQRVSVICLERPGVLAPQASSLGAQVVCMDKRPGVCLGLIARLRGVLRELAPQVVHTHQIGTLFYAGPASRWAGVRLVVHTEHGRENYAGRARTRHLGRLAGRFAARFYCLNKDMADEVMAQRIVPADKVRVILNGIDTAHFANASPSTGLRQSLGIPQGAPVIGTVGRLSRIKRYDRLLRIFKSVLARLPDVHLLLVGDGPLAAELRMLADELGLADRVHFVGYQPDSAPYLRLMDVFALTSDSEGTPQCVLEASMAGAPVVATRVGGLPELIEDGRTGTLVAPADETAFSAAICAMLLDGAKARVIAEAARSRVRDRFDIGRMAAEYHRDFLELLSVKAAL